MADGTSGQQAADLDKDVKKAAEETRIAAVSEAGKKPPAKAASKPTIKRPAPELGPARSMRRSPREGEEEHGEERREDPDEHEEAKSVGGAAESVATDSAGGD